MFLVGLLLSTGAVAQDPASQPATSTAVCTFADQKQMSVRYNQLVVDKKDELPLGKLWTPGDAPMDLFTETPLLLNSKEIPVGAYRVYLIPEKDKWTLIVNKDVTAGSKYDEQQDLVRAPMQTGKLPQAEPRFSIYFGHIAPKQCSMRVDVGKTRAWVDFDEK
jgi:hypothetical protein